MTEQSQQQPATPPANATDARAALDARVADKAWGERVLSGDIAANKEFRDLTAKVAQGGADVVAAAITGGPLPEIPTSQQRLTAGAVDWFRELGINDQVTSQFLNGEKVTPAEYERVSNWKKTVMGDKSPGGFVERYLGGDVIAKQKMLLANSVLVNGVKSDAA